MFWSRKPEFRNLYLSKTQCFLNAKKTKIANLHWNFGNWPKHPWVSLKLSNFAKGPLPKLQNCRSGSSKHLPGVVVVKIVSKTPFLHSWWAPSELFCFRVSIWGLESQFMVFSTDIVFFFEVMKILPSKNLFWHSSWGSSDCFCLKVSIWGLERPFHGIFDGHKFFTTFRDFKKWFGQSYFGLIWNLEAFLRRKKIVLNGCLPRKCSQTSFSKLQTPKTTKIYLFALKPPKLPEGPLWASSSRRVLSHHFWMFTPTYRGSHPFGSCNLRMVRSTHIGRPPWMVVTAWLQSEHASVIRWRQWIQPLLTRWTAPHSNECSILKGIFNNEWVPSKQFMIGVCVRHWTWTSTV